MELLPGDRENLAIQTRGGPEKHEVTGWVLVSISCVPLRETVGKPEGAAVPPLVMELHPFASMMAPSCREAGRAQVRGVAPAPLAKAGVETGRGNSLSLQFCRSNRLDAACSRKDLSSCLHFLVKRAVL